MTSRWGSCQPKRGLITLNKRLLEVPRNCIEYVVMHEFVHFIHPNHSKQFYEFLSVLMPDWKERKAFLEKSYFYSV
jgi:predicted metal-dependent hydrolase